MVTRIGDKPAEQQIYRDEFGCTVFGNSSGRNYTVKHPSGFEMEVLFQTGAFDVNSVNGLTNEQLIAIVIDRIGKLDAEVPSRENKSAIHHLEDALANLHLRSAKARMEKELVV